MKYKADTISMYELENLKNIYSESDITIELDKEKTFFSFTKIINGSTHIGLFADMINYDESKLTHRIELYKRGSFIGNITILK